MRLLAVPLLTFTASYLTVLIAGELRVDGFLDERYLSPMLVPFLLLAVAGVSGLWRQLAGSRPVAIGTSGNRNRHLGALAVGSAATLALAVYLASNAVASVSFAINSGRTGVGYNSREVLSSELAQATVGISGTPGLLSNDPQRVYWVTGRHPIPGGAVLGEDGDPASAVRYRMTRRRHPLREFTKPRTGQGISADQLRDWGVVSTRSATVTEPSTRSASARAPDRWRQRSGHAGGPNRPGGTGVTCRLTRVVRRRGGVA